MRGVIAVDSSSAARVCLERQYPKDGNYAPGHPSPVIEYVRIYYKFLVNLRAQFPGWRVVLCLDPEDSSEVFRKNYLIDYYDKELKIYTHPDFPNNQLCCYDTIWRGVKLTPEGNYEVVALTRKKAKALMAKGFQETDWYALEGELIKVIEQHVRPNYKYGRKWPHSKFMSKQFFNCHRNRTAKNLASIFGIEVWESPGLEADDLVFRLAEACVSQPFVAVTTDKDINQIYNFHTQARILRLGTNILEKAIPLEQSQRDTWTKLLLGERSKGQDYIMPAVNYKKGTSVTESAAKKLVDGVMALSGGRAKMDFLHETVTKESLEKNIKTMLLKAAPLPSTMPSVPQLEVSLSTFHITEDEAAFWKQRAEAMNSQLTST